MSNISFSRSVFKKLILQTLKNQGLFGKGLICCLQIILKFEFLLFGTELTHNHILKLYIGEVTRLHPYSDWSIDSIRFWTTKFWLLKIFGWRHPRVNSLPHNHHFKHPGKESYWKHCRKREKCWYPAFSPLSAMFSTLPNINFNFWVKIILSPGNALNLDQSKIMLFDEELKSPLCKGWVKKITFCLAQLNLNKDQNWKNLQRTYHIYLKY